MGILIGERAEGSVVAASNGSYAEDTTPANKIVAICDYDAATHKFTYTATKAQPYIELSVSDDEATHIIVKLPSGQKEPFDKHTLLITGSSQADTVNIEKFNNCTIKTGLGTDSVFINSGQGNQVHTDDSLYLTINGISKFRSRGNILQGNDNDNFLNVAIGTGTYNEFNRIFAGAGNDTVCFFDGTSAGTNYIDAGTGNDSVSVTGFAAVTLGEGEDTLQLADGACVSLADLTSADEIYLSAEVMAATLSDDNQTLTFADTDSVLFLTGNTDMTLWQNAKVNGGKTLGELLGLFPAPPADGNDDDAAGDGGDSGDAENDAQENSTPLSPPQPVPSSPLPPLPTVNRANPADEIADAAEEQQIAPAVGLRYSMAAAELMNRRNFIRIADINSYTLRNDGNLEFVTADGDTVTALLSDNENTGGGCLVRLIDARGRKLTFGHNGGENFAALDGTDSKTPVYWDGTWCDNTGQLIGSKYRDTIKAAYGETVYGGRGGDRIELAADGETETIILTAQGGSDSIYGFQSGFDLWDSDIVKFSQDELVMGRVKIDSAGNTIVKIGSSRVVLVNENNNADATDYILVEDKDGRKNRIAVGARNVTMSADNLTGEYADWYIGTGKSAVDFGNYEQNVVADLGNSGLWGQTANFLNIHTVTGAAGYANILVGESHRNDKLLGGTEGAANSLWGGAEGRDTLIGGTNAENIYYFGAGDGQDILQNIQSSDKVMFYNLGIGDLRELIWRDATCIAEFTDGSRLTLDNLPENFIACFTDISYAYQKGRFVGIA